MDKEKPRSTAYPAAMDAGSVYSLDVFLIGVGSVRTLGVGAGGDFRTAEVDGLGAYGLTVGGVGTAGCGKAAARPAAAVHGFYRRF